MLVYHINEVGTSKEIHDSCSNLVVSAWTLLLIIFSILPGVSGLSLQRNLTPAITTATWPAQQFAVLQNSSSWMQRCRVSSKSITLNGSNIQSPSTKDPSKELMDQRFDGRFITDSPQVTFNRAGKNSQKCCGILKETSLDMPVKTSMFYSMTFMIFCVIKTPGKIRTKSHSDCSDTCKQIISPN